MGTALVALLLIALLFGGGFAIKALWYVAVVMLLLWVLGFVTRGAERSWYRW